MTELSFPVFQRAASKVSKSVWLQDILNLFCSRAKDYAEQAYAQHRASEEGVSYKGSLRKRFLRIRRSLSQSSRSPLCGTANAGLNPDIGSIDEFLERRCIDESTASLINVLFEEDKFDSDEMIQDAVMNAKRA